MKRSRLVFALLAAAGLAAPTPAGGRSAPAEPSAADVLCADVPADVRSRCGDLCAAWPASPECLLLRRFGAAGVEVLREARAGGDAEAAAARHGFAADEVRRLLLYLDAERLYLRSGVDAQAYGPEERDAIGEMGRLFAQAGALYRAGQLLEARTAAERALALSRRVLGPEHRATGACLTNLGIVRMGLGDLAGARLDYERALVTYEKALGPDHPDTAAVEANIGGLLLTMGDLAGARPYLERAMAVQEAVLGPEHPTTAVNLNNLGALLRTLGDLAGARPRMERALAVFEEVRGPDHVETAQCRMGLGSLLSSSGDLAGARRHVERALTTFEQVLGPGHQDTARCRYNLGVLVAALGDPAGARALMERALESLETALGPDHADAALIRSGLGLALRAAGEVGEARAHFERALAIRGRALGPDHPDTVTSVADLAVLDWDAGDKAAARKGAARAVHARREHFQRNLDAVTDDRQLRALLESVRASFDLFLSVFEEAGDGPGVFAQVLAWQGAAGWAERLGRDVARAEAEGTRDQRALLARYREAARERTRLLMTPVPEPQRAERARGLADLAAELDGILRRLASELPAFQRRQAVLDATPEGACAALAAGDAALVDFLLYARLEPRARPGTPGERRYLALVVAPGGCRVMRVELGPATDVDALVEAWRAAVERVETSGGTNRLDLQRLDMAGAALRAAVWDPVAAHLPAAGRVYVVPDGRLTEVPLGASPLGDGRYLLEERELAYLTAPAELLRPYGHADPEAAEGLVVGDIDYGAAGPEDAAAEWDRVVAPGCTAVAQASTMPTGATTALAGTPVCGWETREWARLETEAPAVAQLLCGTLPGGAWLATAVGAAEPLVRAALPGKRVVHFATHGFWASAEACGRPETQAMLRYGAFGGPAIVAGTDFGGPPPVDPLTLGGLVLAGAAVLVPGTAPARDGILSGREVAGLDLSAAELVVLSACETGRGEVHAGEGALGLGRAFQIAGARSVVVSQWKVPAAETGALFEDFYRRLYGPAAPGVERPDAVTALREAQLTRLRAAREGGLPASAFLWGAFVALR